MDPVKKITIRVNGQIQEVSEGLSVKDLLQLLDVPERGVAVEHNLEVLPQEAFSKTRLREGDQLEIIHFVGGGSCIR